MTDQEQNSNTLIIFIIILIIVFIAGLIALYFFILIPQKDEILNKKNTGIINIKERPIKKLNREIFNNEGFSKLQDSGFEARSLTEISTGKRNIFFDEGK